jgi:hypothetical protein
MAENLEKLLPKGRTPVLNPSGELGTVPTENLDSVLSAGYRVAPAEEVHQALIEKKFGGASGEVAAALAGAARGATLNLSDLALTKTGLVAPETLSGLQEANPLASGVGQAAGIAGSVFLAPGASLPGLLSKGAAKTAAVATSGLAKHAIAQRIAAGTLSGALEGTAYGLGQSVTEHALGDPTLNAQKVFHNMGMGMIFGGAIGGGMATLGAGVSGVRNILGKYGRDIPEVPVTGEAPLVTEPVGAVEAPTTNDVKLAAKLTFNDKTPVDPKVVTKFRMNKDRILARPSWEESEKSIRQGMEELNTKIGELSTKAEGAVEASGYKAEAKPLAKWLENKISDLSGSPATREAQGAISELKFYLNGTDELPGIAKLETVDAPTLRTYMQKLRQDIQNFFSAQGGSRVSEEDYVIYQFQKELDKILKKNVGGYEDVMAEMAPLQNAKKSFLREFKTDTSIKDSFTRTIERNLYKGTEPPAEKTFRNIFRSKADAIKKFGDATNTDYFGWYDDIATRRALFPEDAKPMDWGTATANIFRMAKKLTSPTEITGEITGSIIGKMTATPGERTGIISSLQRAAAQKELLGGVPGGSSRIVDTINKAIQGGSKLFKPDGALAQLMVPEGVVAMQHMTRHEHLGTYERRVETLIALERATNDANKKIDVAVKGIFGEAEPAKPNRKLTDFLADQTPEKHGKEWDAIANDLRDLTTNPQNLMERISAGISGIEDDAPETAAALSMTAARAVSFLAQHVTVPERKAFDGKFIPSKIQLIQAAKYMRTINNPYSALEELCTGNVSRETKDVLTNVYPELYQHLQSQVMQGIAAQQAKGKIIPQSKRLGLAYFLDQELDSGMTSVAMMSNRAALMRHNNRGAMPTSPTKQGTSSSRMMTPLQRAANR